MSKTNKNSSKESVFSAALTAAIAWACSDRCLTGEAATRDEVADALLKSKRFTQDNRTLLTVMIGEAVKHGEVPGYMTRRGPGGGIFNVKALAKRMGVSEEDVLKRYAA